MAKDFQRLLADIKTRVKGITDDSRKVKTGFLFIAIKGLTLDGDKFVTQARESGARLVVGERGKVDIKVPDSRKALSLLASAYYGHPSKKLKIIGVTGTDGKTTTASLIHWILKKSGKKVGLVSTVSAKIGDRQYDTGLHTTNPEPLILQEFLSKMVKAKCEYAVLEVTSHGLDQNRVYGINFDTSVLTNITQEHLDYHKSLNNYAKAKAKLFNSSEFSIINKKYYRLTAKHVNRKANTLLYDNKTLVGEIRKAVMDRFIEPYNLLNATAAILTVRKFGITDKKIIKAIRSFPPVEGRMQEVKNRKGIRIIVDFAHAPNALESVLKVLRKQTPKGKNLITVFGCSGERDIKKRPLMAKISSRLANISVFTAEDPRSEKVRDIISQMLKGVVTKQSKIYSIEDRKRAISFAITKLAKKGDTVVICGKGHEKSMNISGVEYPWSDRKAVLSSLKMINKEKLNSLCLKRIKDYQNLNIYGKKVCTPYYINDIEPFFTKLMKRAKISDEKISKFRTLYKERGIPYGWYRGKGTPEEITKAILEISEIEGIHLHKASAGAILEFMKLYGLGIDCSGFVYNVLSYAFSKIKKDKQFNDSLDWENTNHTGANKAGVFVFGGKASEIVKPEDLEPLDLAILRSPGSNEYNHIAIALKVNSKFVIAQSQLSVSPSGINISNLKVSKKTPLFGHIPQIGKSWKELYSKGLIKFRRLRILEQ